MLWYLQLLAVVYDAFTTIEKEKFRKLIIHKQKASNFAFNLLVSKGSPNGVSFRHFYGMMSFVDSEKCNSRKIRCNCDAFDVNNQRGKMYALKPDEICMQICSQKIGKYTVKYPVIFIFEHKIFYLTHLNSALHKYTRFRKREVEA